MESMCCGKLCLDIKRFCTRMRSSFNSVFRKAIEVLSYEHHSELVSPHEEVDRSQS